MAQQSSLKNRVDILEQELASLKARINGNPASPWWVELFGVCKDDPLFDKAMKLGAQYRQSLRPKRASLCPTGKSSRVLQAYEGTRVLRSGSG